MENTEAYAHQIHEASILVTSSEDIKRKVHNTLSFAESLSKSPFEQDTSKNTDREAQTEYLVWKVISTTACYAKKHMCTVLSGIFVSGRTVLSKPCNDVESYGCVLNRSIDFVLLAHLCQQLHAKGPEAHLFSNVHDVFLQIIGSND